MQNNVRLLHQMKPQTRIALVSSTKSIRHLHEKVTLRRLRMCVMEAINWH